MQRPTFAHERELARQGFIAIAGVDEAGSGALAGPVVAAAVVLPLTSRFGRLHDSKLLTPTERERLFEAIVDRCDAWAVGEASVEEIHALNIRRASILAMHRAIQGIPHADYALVDAWSIPELGIPQRSLIRGDRSVKSIAAASIIAKVFRDRLMCELAQQYPAYGFEVHKGYGTDTHREAIRTLGPCEAHRVGFRGVVAT